MLISFCNNYMLPYGHYMAMTILALHGHDHIGITWSHYMAMTILALHGHDHIGITWSLNWYNNRN